MSQSAPVFSSMPANPCWARWRVTALSRSHMLSEPCIGKRIMCRWPTLCAMRERFRRGQMILPLSLLLSEASHSGQVGTRMGLRFSTPYTARARTILVRSTTPAQRISFCFSRMEKTTPASSTCRLSLKRVSGLTPQSTRFEPRHRLELLSLAEPSWAKLRGETGGQMFRGDDSQQAVDEDLRIIEDGLRNRYRLIFRRANLKPDGTFHRITLLGPDRVKQIGVQSGYYAPAH